MDFRIQKVSEGHGLWPLVCEHFPRAVKWLSDPNDHGDYHFFLALDPQGEFLGGSVIDVGPMDYGPLSGRMEGFLEDVEVVQAHRRRGIGTALVRAALDFAWQRDAQHVCWTVACSNRVGIAFYDSLGFAIVPEKDDQNPADEYYAVIATNPARRGRTKLKAGGAG